MCLERVEDRSTPVKGKPSVLLPPKCRKKKDTKANFKFGTYLVVTDACPKIYFIIIEQSTELKLYADSTYESCCFRKELQL